MRRQINAYLAVLCITIVGAAATLLIVRVTYATTFNIVLVSGATSYAYYLE
jgi:hypothetical protein